MGANSVGQRQESQRTDAKTKNRGEFYKDGHVGYSSRRVFRSSHIGDWKEY